MESRSLLLLLVLSVAGPAGAKTLYVANDGTDSPSCGKKAAACRSITQGIANAADGDTVDVGPGYYGDLDGDGTRGETGEEAGVDYLVDVTKAVRVVSARGAGVTMIEAVGGVSAVRIGASDVEFGQRNRGFTVRSASESGIQVSGFRVKVAGNVVRDSAIGIHVFAGDQAEITDNRVHDNDVGLSLDAGPCLAARNAAIGNQTVGIVASGAGCVLDGNTMIDNGFTVGTGIGLELGGTTGVAARRSTILGNRALGVLVGGSGHVLEGSSLYGNGDAAALETNCALMGAGALVATGNYWGSATGPGANPADLVCMMDVPLDPFATKAQPPDLKPLR